MISPAKALVLGASLAVPDLAYAHAPIQGIDAFYNGLLHPFLVPAHLLLGIATGLFIGQQGLKENQPAVAAFLLAAFAGLIVAWFEAGGALEMFLLSGAAIMGLLVALNPPVGRYWCALIAASIGLLLGMDSTQETMTGQEKLVSFIGTGLGIFLLLLAPMGLTDYLYEKQGWQRIGVRIVGSWVAASSLLVLALSFSQSL